MINNTPFSGGKFLEKLENDYARTGDEHQEL